MTTPGQRQAEQLAELIARLRAAGLDLSAPEVADALWLAARTGPGRRPGGAAGGGAGTGEARPSAHPLSGALSGTSRPGLAGAQRDGEPALRTTEHTAPVSLYVPSGPDAAPLRSFPIRAPATGSLSGLLGLQRALRPLRGYRPPVPPVLGTELDEEATAERSAREGLLRPVRRPARHREAEIQLLMDASPTTSVWQLTLERLRQACERLGAFRDVQVHYLHPGPDGTPMAGTGADPVRTRLRPADQHRDITGRRLTLVVSDCAGPLWQSGGAQRLLHRWAGASQVAVVQPLPPRLWERTALPAGPGLLVREPAAGGMGFVPDAADPYAAAPGPGALPVPVLLPTERVLGSWAQLLGGNGRRTMRGAAAWVRADHPAQLGTGAYGAGARTPQAALRDFQATASPGALELAVHLAAVPLYLPVMQLVQEALLPHTGPMQLAEVLLGGLLERLPEVPEVPGPRYDFAPGVRELLLGMLDRGAAELVLKYLSEYISRRFGKGVRNFPALAVARLQGREPSEPDEPEREEEAQAAAAREALFAHVSARVVRWYQPVLPVPGRLDEAERLLGLWRAQRDRQLLADAQALAEAARAEGGGERSRRVLGQVLHAQAGTAEERRTPGRARRLLLRAQQLLSGDEPATAVARAAVQHDLWRREPGSPLLHAAVESLRSVRAEEADTATRTARRLGLGRVLLDLARTETAPAVRAAYADEAVRELRAAHGLLTSSDAPTHRRCTALLDLVAALRLAGGDDIGDLLELTAQAEAAAGDSDPLRLRCRRERARIHREAGDWEPATASYAEAERCAPRDSPARCELLAEWGEMLLLEAQAVDRAEGILREALTNVSPQAPLRWRLHLLLGTALVERYRGERRGGGFLPDLYEGVHLLDQSARKGVESATRARSWLLLAAAQLEFPGAARHFTAAEAAYGRALREVGKPTSITAARTLHGRGVLYERMGRPAAALADYQAAEGHWRRLAEEGKQLPQDERGATRERLAALEG